MDDSTSNRNAPMLVRLGEDELIKALQIPYDATKER